MEFKIKDIVKNNMTHFSFLRGENAYYTVPVGDAKYIYPGSLVDLAGGLHLRGNEGDHHDALHPESARRRGLRQSASDGAFLNRMYLLPGFDRSIMYSAATVEKKTRGCSR